MAKKHNESNNSKHNDSSAGTIVLVLAVLAIIIVVGALVILKPFGQRIDYSTYNGFNFVQLQDNVWQTTVEMDEQLYDIPFYNHPLELQDFPYDNAVTKYIQDVIVTITPKREINIAIHPDSGSTPVLAGVNIARITGKFFGAYTQSALYLEEDERDEYADFDVPLVTCDDASFLSPIIWINVNSTNTGVSMSDTNAHCIVVEATNPDDILKAGDIVGYKLLGIMK